LFIFFLHLLNNDEEVNRFLDTGDNYTKEMLIDHLKNVAELDIYYWAIHIKINGLHIGNIKIDPIYQRHGLAEYSIMMGRKTEWGKGYAKEASTKIIDFRFKELKIRKLTLGVVADHKSAVNLYKGLAFQVEGIHKYTGFFL